MWPLQSGLGLVSSSNFRHCQQFVSVRPQERWQSHSLYRRTRPDLHELSGLRFFVLACLKTAIEFILSFYRQPLSTLHSLFESKSVPIKGKIIKDIPAPGLYVHNSPGKRLH